MSTMTAHHLLQKKRSRGKIPNVRAILNFCMDVVNVPSMGSLEKDPTGLAIPSMGTMMIAAIMTDTKAMVNVRTIGSPEKELIDHAIPSFCTDAIIAPTAGIKTKATTKTIKSMLAIIIMGKKAMYPAFLVMLTITAMVSAASDTLISRSESIELFSSPFTLYIYYTQTLT